MTQSALGIFSAAGAGGGPAPTSPVLTNLRLWYDANDTSTITVNSGRASAITNKASGYTWTLSQGTSGRQPQIVAAAQNGKQVLRYASARNDSLEKFTLDGPMTGATLMTIFGVFKSTESLSGIKFKFSFGKDGARNAGYGFFDTNKNHFQTGSGTNSLLLSANLTNVPNIQAVQMTSGGLQFMRTYTNGTILESVTGGTDTFTISGSESPGEVQQYTIGAGQFAGYAASFDFCELLTYNGILSTNDFNQNISYLTAKWGV
jgi:hypothetical protein